MVSEPSVQGLENISRYDETYQNGSRALVDVMKLFRMGLGSGTPV